MKSWVLELRNYIRRAGRPGRCRHLNEVLSIRTQESTDDHHLRQDRQTSMKSWVLELRNRMSDYRWEPNPHLNEVLSIRTQESVISRCSPTKSHHLNEVLSIRTQEFVFDFTGL